MELSKLTVARRKLSPEALPQTREPVTIDSRKAFFLSLGWPRILENDPGTYGSVHGKDKGRPHSLTIANFRGDIEWESVNK